ncbi:MAG: TM2 domain-containing protein [Fibrobacter sp.]|nr:TM2 domain-containing protein [Fibrobacter sp.]
MFCSKCGASNSDEAKFCESCGNQLKQVQPQTDNLNSNGNGTVPSAPNQVANPSAPSIIVNVSNNQQNQGVGAALGGLVNPAVLPGPKSRETAGLLCLFLGVFGAHDFYIGKSISGIIKLLCTLTGVGATITCIWAMIDAFIIAFGSNPTDNWGRPLVGDATFTKILIFVPIILCALLIGLIIAFCSSL